MIIMIIIITIIIICGKVAFPADFPFSRFYFLGLEDDHMAATVEIFPAGR